jgi:hypothetical protein
MTGTKADIFTEEGLSTVEDSAAGVSHPNTISYGDSKFVFEGII